MTFGLNPLDTNPTRTVTHIVRERGEDTVTSTIRNGTSNVLAPEHEIASCIYKWTSVANALIKDKAFKNKSCGR